MIVKGVVYKVFSRPAGRGTAYSIKLEGNDVYYGCGFKDPGLNPGDAVQFEANLNAKNYWEVDPKSIRKLDSTPVIHNPTARQAVAVNGKDDYWTRKEQRDIANDVARNIGASTNTAISFVELLLKAEAVKLPAKIADREQVLAELVSYYAKKFRGESTEDEAPTPTPVVEQAAVEAPDAANWN
jgi:hypothetical protein